MTSLAISLGINSVAVLNRGSGGTPAPTPAPSSPISAVATDGWQATMVTPADLALSPVSVSRQGFTTAGATTTISETLYTAKRVRKPYPLQAEPTAALVALSDYVYSTDTISGVTNSSAESSPKPVANWALTDRHVVGDSLTVEIVAFHRNGVARVEARATDGTTTVTGASTSPVVSPQSGDSYPVLVYRITLDLSTLSDNADITVNAKVYPRIGAAASVLDSADQSERRHFSPRTYRRNTARFAAPYYVAVASGGNDTTGAVSNVSAATAEATPCATLVGAINRARTVLGTTAGALDGLRVRLPNGTVSLAANPTANTVNAEIVVEPATGVTKAQAVIDWGGGAFRFNLNFVRLRGITLNRVGNSGTLPGGTSGHHAVVDGCDIALGTSNAAWGSTAGTGIYFTGGNTITGSLNAVLNAGTVETRLIRGTVAGVANDGAQVEAWCILGSALKGIRFNHGVRATSGMIVAFNALTHLGGSGGPTLVIDSAAGDTNGAAFVQNIVEYTSATSNTAPSFSADSGNQSIIHLCSWHNTIAGFDIYGRSNLLYNETPGVARAHKLASFVGNIHAQINTKHDVFHTDGTRIQSWAYLYGVGCQGEFARYRSASAGGFAQEYPGMGSVIGTANTGAGNDPLFTSYAGTTPTPSAGAGGGTYTIGSGSPAKSLVTSSPVPFDAAGNARSGTVAAGAFL